MRHRVRLSIACTGLFLAALTHAVVTGQPQQPPPTATSSAPVQAQPGAGEYAGTAACLSCHSDKEQDYKTQLHGKSADPRTPAAAQGCESCHGPAKKHAEDPSDTSTLKVFRTMAPREANATCLTCHAKADHALWQGSAHDARNLSCITCHSIHSPKSARAQLRAATEMETCATCHKQQVVKQMRASHMPLREGKNDLLHLPQSARRDQRQAAAGRQLDQ